MTKLTKLANAFVVATALLLMAAGPIAAQSCDTSSLGTCLTNSGASCRNSLSGCADDYSAGLSALDAQDLAIDRCCAFAATKKQRRCFNAVINKLARAQRPRSIVNNFIRSSRVAVVAARNAGCSTGSLR